MGFKKRVILATVFFAVALTLIFMFFKPGTLQSFLLAITAFCTNLRMISTAYRLIFHQNILHLLGNAYGIYFVGIILEDKIGSWKFLAIYLIRNIAAFIV